MAENEGTQNPPTTEPNTETQPQGTANQDEANWTRLEGMIEKAVTKAWQGHSSKGSETDSKGSSKESGDQKTPKKSFLEKLITG